MYVIEFNLKKVVWFNITKGIQKETYRSVTPTIGDSSKVIKKRRKRKDVLSGKKPTKLVLLRWHFHNTDSNINTTSSPIAGLIQGDDFENQKKNSKPDFCGIIWKQFKTI